MDKNFFIIVFQQDQMWPESGIRINSYGYLGHPDAQRQCSDNTLNNPRIRIHRLAPDLWWNGNCSCIPGISTQYALPNMISGFMPPPLPA